LCLGAGVFIGGGLSQGNLLATGASIGSVQNVNVGSEIDALTAQISDVQKSIQDIEGRIQAKVSDLQGINDKLSIAGNTRDEPVLDMEYGLDWRTTEYWSPHNAYYISTVAALR
jgi:hypothetical protein